MPAFFRAVAQSLKPRAFKIVIVGSSQSGKTAYLATLPDETRDTRIRLEPAKGATATFRYIEQIKQRWARGERGEGTLATTELRFRLSTPVAGSLRERLLANEVGALDVTMDFADTKGGDITDAARCEVNAEAEIDGLFADAHSILWVVDPGASVRSPEDRKALLQEASLVRANLLALPRIRCPRLAIVFTKRDFFTGTEIEARLQEPDAFATELFGTDLSDIRHRLGVRNVKAFAVTSWGGHGGSEEDSRHAAPPAEIRPAGVVQSFHWAAEGALAFRSRCYQFVLKKPGRAALLAAALTLTVGASVALYQRAALPAIPPRLETRTPEYLEERLRAYREHVDHSLWSLLSDSEARRRETVIRAELDRRERAAVLGGFDPGRSTLAACVAKIRELLALRPATDLGRTARAEQVDEIRAVIDSQKLTAHLTSILRRSRTTPRARFTTEVKEQRKLSEHLSASGSKRLELALSGRALEYLPQSFRGQPRDATNLLEFASWYQSVFEKKPDQATFRTAEARCGEALSTSTRRLVFQTKTLAALPVRGILDHIDSVQKLSGPAAKKLRASIAPALSRLICDALPKTRATVGPLLRYHNACTRAASVITESMLTSEARSCLAGIRGLFAGTTLTVTVDSAWHQREEGGKADLYVKLTSGKRLMGRTGVQPNRAHARFDKQIPVRKCTPYSDLVLNLWDSDSGLRGSDDRLAYATIHVLGSLDGRTYTASGKHWGIKFRVTANDADVRRVLRGGGNR